MSKTPVSILQELMVQRKMVPNYEIETCTDMLGAPFKCIITFDRACIQAYGPNKKEAKQNAALKALQMLGINIQNNYGAISTINKVTLNNNNVKNVPLVNYVGKLNEYASSHGKMYPTYIDNITPINGGYVTYCNFLNMKTEGCGMKKKDSKQDAARKMLEKLRSEDISITVTEKISELHIEKVKRIDDLSNILKRYENLKTTEKISTVETKFTPNVKIEVDSVEDLRQELQKYNVKYTVETFQREPYIMMMKVDDSTVTIMGKGETKMKALADMYDTALKMFREGFTW